MSSAAARAGPAAPAEQTLAVPAARGLAFLALCGFAALQWMHMLEPVAGQRAGYTILVAAFAICGLLLARTLPPRARTPAAVLVALAAMALALLAGGVADEQLLPGRWGELAAGIGRGISALPGARVPYRGLDEWTRLVLCLGGTTLAVLATLTAFWPRRRELGLRHVSLVLLMTLYAVPAVALDLSSLPGARVPYRGLDEWTRLVLCLGGTTLAVLATLTAFWPRRRGLGLHLVALILLVTLYAVPAVALDLSSEFLSGAVLALLVLAYLRLERLRMSDAQAASLLAVGVVILGLVAAPALDTGRPWFDYETWALSNASARSTAFNWQHTYGPLDWPRDGRELLRVKAKRAAYWKAMNLDDFDGSRWVRDRLSANVDGCDVAGYYPEQRDKWLQSISVSVRNLRTQTFVTAGVACSVDAPRITPLPLGDGTYATTTRSLRRGDAYKALVYTPAPTYIQGWRLRAG